MDDSGVQVLQLSKKDYVKTFLSGFFMNTLNPNVFIFWLTTSTTLITLSRENRDHCICYLSCVCAVNRYFKSNDGAKDQEKIDTPQHTNTKSH